MQGHTTDHLCPYATRSARGMLQYIATKIRCYYRYSVFSNR